MSRNRNLRGKVSFPRSGAAEDGLPKDNGSGKCLNVSRVYKNILSSFCGPGPGPGPGPEPGDDISRSCTPDIDNDNGSFISSSTLSWEDDYEQHYTQKVASELRTMERILRGEEPVPSNYDQEEYSLWIRTFPNGRLLEDKQQKAPKSTGNKGKETATSNCNRKVKKPSTFVKDLTPWFEDILQISPMPIGTSRKRPYNTMSQKFAESKRILAVRAPPSPEHSFNSLPEIAVDNFVASAPQRRHGSSANTKSAKAKASDEKKTKNSSFLPPLSNNSSSREFRSFSITPRQRARNGTSAISDILTTTRHFYNSRTSSLNTEQF